MSEATASRSSTSYMVNVSSRVERGLTVGALREFVRMLDEWDIPDGVQLVADHDHNTRHFQQLRIIHRVVVARGDDEQ